MRRLFAISLLFAACNPPETPPEAMTCDNVVCPEGLEQIGCTDIPDYLFQVVCKNPDGVPPSLRRPTEEP